MAVVVTRRSPQAARYRAEGLWEDRLIDGLLLDAAAAFPERVALVDGERRVTYGELAARVERAVGGLHALGVRRGEVVSFQLPNWLEAAVVHHATLRLGAVSNPVIPIYRGREVRFILRQARSRVLVVPDVFRGFDHRAMAARLRDELPDLEHVVVVGEPGPGTVRFDDALGAGASVPVAPPVTRSPADPALLLYTSGTEADPKGVVHSHETAVYESRSIAALYELTAADRVLMPSPVTHITGLIYGLQLPFMLGTRVVLQDVWNAERALELIERERCSVVIGATPFLHGLATSPELPRRDVSSLRVFGCGGADVPPELIRSASRALGIRASRLYGSTECPAVTGSALRAPERCHAETDGAPIGGGEARVVSEEDAGVVLREPGARGLLQVRGPELCLGYLDPALDDAAFDADGWFATGDIATIDADGCVLIAGRAKDVIVRGGENISAKEVEDLLFEHPAVREVAVVGYPDAVLGERACAFVVADGQLTLDTLIAFLRAREVANQKLPERLRVVEELPKTSSGKVQKFRLRASLREEEAVA
ncbi:AMP-binding protein [Conexibacter woesei]|uniref:AMP-dependent synthetase and ligase n=1 Tax=Conexibacter woesei (strain DSM 14684 / CCUG 47730 / CIP 108061 / JCM 11494 / NBRC 100937 / ID131577) TaxID=469383 RepID=D3F3I6_CONWI|nr:AMP-binding protein [Conexibacter woesei]ADB52351.1 AMP-dependent synthetase and ligase [Conexibacter woesei DSM 14684]